MAWRVAVKPRDLQQGIYLAPVVCLLALAILVRGHQRILYPNPLDLTGDHLKYIAMADHPFGADALARTPPFAWRILVPLLVHMMPLALNRGFWVLTLVGLCGATLALMWFLRGLGLRRSSTIAGGFAFVALGHATGFPLWDFYLVDPLSFALLALALAAAVHRRGAILLVTLIAGAATKETALFGALFALLWAWERRDRQMMRWASMASLACFGALGLIHLLVPVSMPYSLVDELRTVHDHYAPTLNAEQSRVTLATAGTWGLLLPVAALQAVHAPRLWRSPACILLLTLATLQIAIATNVERVVVYAFPVVIAAAAFEVEYLAEYFRVKRMHLWTPIILLSFVWWAPMAHFNSVGVLINYILGNLTQSSWEQALLILTTLLVALATFAASRHVRSPMTWLSARLRPASQTDDAHHLRGEVFSPSSVTPTREVSAWNTAETRKLP